MDPVFGGLAIGVSYARAMIAKITIASFTALGLLGIGSYLASREIPRELSEVIVTETGVEFTKKTKMNDCTHFGFYHKDEGCVPYIKVNGLEDCLIGTDLKNAQKMRCSEKCYIQKRI